MTAFRRHVGGYPLGEPQRLAMMRAMFLIWTSLIVAGVVFYSIVGLAHH